MAMPLVKRALQRRVGKEERPPHGALENALVVREHAGVDLLPTREVECQGRVVDGHGWVLGICLLSKGSC
ncbi:hypothetical protein ATCV1_z176R [Acanthocystis turfacea chlorella virus 1]|uniref:Uncharacterized protein z176R n=1 Tax=Chlorovirus heliozoae TaxID=322019 RepID=A7K8D6_9PHYC|nr:hypothetical protein ATCV1_z176R [Acanthocystis turfacea chlorella virus 1]ABT16310.1 hypothetical protein ATCV1_z176R [Acanthocystis turfacea chlorella virus 1]